MTQAAAAYDPAAHECLTELLHLGERLALVTAGEAPPRFTTSRAFGHRTTSSLRDTFEAAVQAGNMAVARRVLDTAVARVSRVISRQLAAQRRAKRQAQSVQFRARARCSFCGSIGPAAVAASATICRTCALNATDVLADPA